MLNQIYPKKNKINMKSKGLKVYCNSCGDKLITFGGLLFSPPDAYTCQKFHLCSNCFMNIYADYICKLPRKRIKKASH